MLLLKQIEKSSHMADGSGEDGQGTDKPTESIKGLALTGQKIQEGSYLKDARTYNSTGLKTVKQAIVTKRP